MKFIHTADWQIGMKAAHVGEAGQHVRDQRLSTAEDVVAAAHHSGAEFILIAGDVFEDNGVDRVLIQRTVDILAKSQVPVYIIAGNHDPLLLYGSVWDHPAWQSNTQIHICRNRAPIQIPGGTLFPCPLYEKYSAANPTAWIPPERDESIRIGVAHGPLAIITNQEQENLIPLDAADSACLDYLALGHWHSARYFESEKTAYSGTHEQAKFGESDSGNILLVTIEQAGATPVVEQIHVGRLTWLMKSEVIQAVGTMNSIVSWLESLESPVSTLIDLRLEGLLFPDDAANLARLRELTTAPRVLYARIDESKMLIAPEDDGWIEQLSSEVYREAARRLVQWADPRNMPAAPSRPSSDIASLALLQLYAFSQKEAI